MFGMMEQQSEFTVLLDRYQNAIRNDEYNKREIERLQKDLRDYRLEFGDLVKSPSKERLEKEAIAGVLPARLTGTGRGHFNADQVRDILVAFTEFNGDEWGYTVERVDEFLNGDEN